MVGEIDEPMQSGARGCGRLLKLLDTSKKNRRRRAYRRPIAELGILLRVSIHEPNTPEADKALGQEAGRSERNEVRRL